MLSEAPRLQGRELHFFDKHDIKVQDICCHAKKKVIAWGTTFAAPKPLFLINNNLR